MSVNPSAGGRWAVAECPCGDEYAADQFDTEAQCNGCGMVFELDTPFLSEYSVQTVQEWLYDD